jgi:hypothetical protein
VTANRPSNQPIPASSPAEQILAHAQAGREVVQDFVPLADSLEWELGQQYLRQRGKKSRRIWLQGRVAMATLVGRGKWTACPCGRPPSKDRFLARASSCSSTSCSLTRTAACAPFAGCCGRFRPFGSRTGPNRPSGLGDLTQAEVDAIQATVNRAGRPLEVVGSTARGGRGPGSDIDYLVPPGSLPHYQGLEGHLPGIDPAHGIVPGVHNPHMGPAIRFEPNAPPRVVPQAQP